MYISMKDYNSSLRKEGFRRFNPTSMDDVNDLVEELIEGGCEEKLREVVHSDKGYVAFWWHPQTDEIVITCFEPDGRATEVRFSPKKSKQA